jgi:nucleoside-diphosphate-sugar epimerase
VPQLVFASSSSVYGDAPSHPTTEESRTRPLSPYGVTKLAAEQLCHAYAQPGLSGMTVAILRYFTVYGPRQRPDMAFRRFIEAAVAGQPIVIYGDGGQTRDFTYVDDVVRANLLAIAAPVEGEAINIGGGRRVSLHAALELIGRATGGDCGSTGARRGQAMPATPGPTEPGPRRCSATARRPTWPPTLPPRWPGCRSGSGRRPAEGSGPP